MKPELVVPDLKGFDLKPYVTYKAGDVDMPELTARDLYDLTYGDRLRMEFEAGELKEEVVKVQEKERKGEVGNIHYEQRPKMFYDTKDGPVG